jgi:hypothetical protein
MHSITVTKHEDPVYAALNALDAAVDTLLGADPTAMTTKQQIAVLRRSKRSAGAFQRSGINS